ncbi:MAG: hypothetical protein ABI587_02970 [Gemmatimonadales bacterium]
MSDQPRNWDKEMADIDRLMANPSAQPPVKSGGLAAPVARGGTFPVATGGRMTTFTTWLRVLLGVGLAVGMTQWPYPTACGFNLAVYLGAISTVVVAGLWSSVTSWQRRLGLAHVLSMLVLLWGLVLSAREILPRIGYARHARVWNCPTGNSVEAPQ